MAKPRPGRTRAIDFVLFGLTAFFCFGAILAQFSPSPSDAPPVREAFDPSLQSITSIDAAARHVRVQAGSDDPEALADAADEFVRKRFYHSYSFFDPHRDWVAYLAGFAWINLRSPVLPEDILDYPEAACSQQVIVFQAIVRELGLDAGVVTLQHHMVAAVKIGGRWEVYDADREISPRSYPLAGLVAGDPAVLAIYGELGRSIDLAGQARRGEISLIKVNANPAPQASLFHRATHLFSRFGWAIFLALALLRQADRYQLRIRLRNNLLPV